MSDFMLRVQKTLRESRIILEQARQEEIKRQIANIERGILEAARNGNTSLVFSYRPEPEVIERFTSQGFVWEPEHFASVMGRFKWRVVE